MEERLYQILDQLEIKYDVYEHQAVFTMEEAAIIDASIPGYAPKNVLVKDKKTKEYYLVLLDANRRLDENELKTITNWNKIRFARPEDLDKVLGLTPGSVSPFGIINPDAKEVIVVLGKEICELQEEALLSFHPCRNTASLTISKKDFLHFLNKVGNKVLCE